jgi:hypothetical protein
MRTIKTLALTAICIAISASALHAQPTSRLLPVTAATTLPPLSNGQTLTIGVWDVTSGGRPLLSETQTLDVDGNGEVSFLFGFTMKQGLDPAAFPSGSSRYLDILDSGGASVLPNGRLSLFASAFTVSPGSGGTVTNVQTGGGLFGGPITTTGTISLDTAFTDARYGRLAAANNWAASQNISGNLGVTGSVSANRVSAVTNGVAVHGIGQIGGQFETGSGWIFLGRGLGHDRVIMDAEGNITTRGTLRVDRGFSHGGVGEINIDAPGVVGGRLKIREDGAVGIGTTNPFAKLDVRGTYAINAADCSQCVTVTSNTTGVYSTTTHPGGKAVIGKHMSTTSNGPSIGVEGETSSPIGDGVRGIHGMNGLGGNGAGVEGTSNSTSGFGVLGKNTAFSGSTIGVMGTVNSPAGTGVIARNFGGTGLRVEGNAVITGNLAKGSGSFKIDHPLDPENKYLSHSFVESPDMMNIYNGNVVLGEDGSAWVDMPSYFEALNREFRYQLTAIGGPGPNLFVAEELSGNRFRIAGGDPGRKVSWQVTGVRRDAFAEKHRIPTEEEKGPSERGYYLHPEAFDQPEEKGLYSSKGVAAKPHVHPDPVLPIR